ncbi:MAG: hypothetical protein AB1567_07040 [bacterium]
MFRNKMILGLIFLVSLGLMADSAQGAWWQFWEKDAQAVVQPEVKESPEAVGTESELAKATEQEGTQTIEAQAIEPKLVMEYKLSEGEEIVDVIFDEAEMTVKEAKALGMKGLEQRKATETVKVQYPKVLVTKKAVKFLDEKRKVTNEIPLKEVQIERVAYKSPLVSLSTNRIILVTQEGEFTFHLDCFDTKGNLIWQKRNLGNPVFLSGNGGYIVSGPLMTAHEAPPVCILCEVKNGKELWNKKINTEFWIPHILHNGQVLILEDFFFEKKSKISLIDIDGKTLWNRELLNTGDWTIVSSELEDKIIIWNWVGHIYVFKKNGDILWDSKKFPTGDINLFLSEDNNYLVILTGNQIFMINTVRGNILWKRNVENDFNYASMSRDNSYLLLTKGPPYFLRQPHLTDKFTILERKTGQIIKIKRKGYIWGELLENEKIFLKSGSDLLMFHLPLSGKERKN